MCKFSCDHTLKVTYSSGGPFDDIAVTNLACSPGCAAWAEGGYATGPQLYVTPQI